MEIYKEVIAALMEMTPKRKMSVVHALASEYPEVFMEIEKGTFLPFHKEIDRPVNHYNPTDEVWLCEDCSRHMPDPTEPLPCLPFWASVALETALAHSMIKAIKLVRSVSKAYSLKDSKDFVDRLVEVHGNGK